MKLTELKEIAAAAGLVGAGGAGFPTAVKLAEGADTLLINAAECEPLLYTDFTLLRDAADRILAGAEAVIEAAGLKQGFLCLKQHAARRLSFIQGQRLSDHVTVALLPDVYPMGDEVILTYQVLRRIVPPAGLPLAVGVIVQNAETLYHLNRAITDGRPFTHTFLTIAGKVSTPIVTEVPIGISVTALLEAAGVSVPDDCVVLDGGPAMGNVINPNTAVVRKATKGLCILPQTIPAVAGKLAQNRTVNVHAAANCCQCTMCTDLCPRALIGYPLKPHLIVRTPLSAVEEQPELYTAAQTCSGCGVCELTSCCQGISPRRVYAQVKGILAKNKLRYTPPAPPRPNPDRDFRLLPLTRFETRIGVSPFDRLPEKRALMLPPAPLTLLLRQHVGAPSKPVVSVGDTVRVGQLLGEPQGAISAALHAPQDGTVVAVTGEAIVLNSR